MKRIGGVTLYKAIDGDKFVCMDNLLRNVYLE